VTDNATGPLLWARDGAIVTLTLNLPETRNALSGDALFAAFETHCAAINADPTIRAVILTGAGPGFSAGGNINEMRDGGGIFGGTPAEIEDKYRKGIQRIPLALSRLEAPIIAAVNGAAIGAGCDLACMCDIRIASTKAIFAESFVKLGIIAGDGGAWYLPRIVGISRASEMAFTGDAIDAETALSYGLVSRVVAPEALMDEARTLAGRIAVNPPQAVRWTKRLIREGQHSSLPSLLDMAASLQALAHHNAEHKEAIAAFFAARAVARAKKDA
jgi:enoyl-CoA hydratase/carnithine racemase